MSTVTEEPIQLSYFVSDITTALATYNRLRWHRSRSGQYGLYEPATGDTAGPATLLSPSQTPHQLNGKTLKFRVNGVTDVSVTFSAADPVTSAQAATAINGATGLVTASDDGNGYLKLLTNGNGSGASIEIQDGDANPFLGFVEGDGAVGTDADTILVSGTHEYFWIDNNSSMDFWYRVEFRNSVTNKTTGLGVPFTPDQAQGVSKSKTIVGYCRLTDLSGNPIGNRKVTLSNPFIPNTVVDQSKTWGVFRHFLEGFTDRNGYVEMRVLRGMQVDISIDGTGFVRRIAVPSSGDGFDFLDPTLVVRDEFGIQQPTIDFAIRTT